MNHSTLKPLLNLAVAAIIAQSAAMPAWGEHLLSCGFTSVLRTIKSVDEVKRQSIARTICIEAKNSGIRSVQQHFFHCSRPCCRQRCAQTPC